MQEAKWELFKKEREADAALYQNLKQAEAEKTTADAAFYREKQAADATPYSKKKQAEALHFMAEAQGFYLGTLLKHLGGNYNALRDYIMLEKDMYVGIAQAVNGLQPKISVWSGAAFQGSGGAQECNGGSMNDMAGIYSMLPPVLKTVHEQTGMQPPAWLGKLPAEESDYR